MPNRLTTAHLNARLQATLNQIDANVSAGKLEVYADPRPTTVDDTPTATKLLELPFTMPCGSVSGGQATLTFSAPGVGLATGTATWARFLDGAGTIVMDCEVSNLAGSALVRLSILTITPGLPVESISATLN